MKELIYYVEMSSFLCFICHNAVNSDTTEETREKYREIVGMNLCPDSHLCYICCHMVNKLWLFKSVCLKRSLEYPVLFSEKCTVTLNRSDIDNLILCPEENCLSNHAAQIYLRCNDNGNQSNDYVQLPDECNNFDDYITEKTKNCVFSVGFYSGGDNLDAILTETVNNETTITGFENNLDSVHDTLINNDYIYNDDINFEVNKTVEGNVEIKIEQNNDVTINYVDNDDIGDAKFDELDTFDDSNNLIKNEEYSFIKTLLSVEEQKAELEAHRKSKSYLGAEFKCYNCALGFLFKDSYQAHMMRHEESNGEFVCELCTLRFASARVLRAHNTSHCERYACARCGVAVRLRQRDTHARSCHERPPGGATCHLCGNVFQDSKGLQQHLKRFHMSKTSNRTYSCNVCGKSYHNQAAVRTHMIKHIQRKFPCDQCSATFSSPYTLTQHKKKHTDTNRGEHMCVTCGVGYASRKCLLAHMRNAMRHQEKMYDCPICSRVCPNQRSLSLHLTRVHSTSKDHACPQCNNKYTSRQSLVRHIKEHTTPRAKIKLAQCDSCGKSFKSNSKLNRHLKDVCQKDKLEEELSAYEEQQNVML